MACAELKHIHNVITILDFLIFIRLNIIQYDIYNNASEACKISMASKNRVKLLDQVKQVEQVKQVKQVRQARQVRQIRQITQAIVVIS